MASSQATRSRGLMAAVERWSGITTSGMAVIGVAVVGWVLGRVIGSRPMFVMVYGLLLLLGMSWVLGRRVLAVKATRSELRSRVREGQVVQVELRLTARRRLSAVVLEETLHGRLGAVVRVPVPSLPSGHEVTHSYTFSPRLRGVYDVGPLVLEWNDPFGLTRRRQVIAKPARIIVHPATESVHDRVISREWEDPPIRPPVSKPWPTGFEFYGMRDYALGDDPRRIAWRASARSYDPGTDSIRYLVRESEQGITDRVNVWLDSDVAVHSPGDPSETFENAVRAAASLARKHLNDGFSVNIDLNQGRVAKNLRGKRAELEAMDVLAAVQPERLELIHSLRRLLTDPTRSAHNVIVTTSLDQQAAATLRLLLQRGSSILLAIVLWEDTDPATLHRAGSLGCGIVEIATDLPLDRAFARVMGAARR